MLCESCAELLNRRSRVNGPEVFWKRRATLLKENSRACQLCKVLYEWLPGADEDDERLHSSVWRALHPHTSPNKDTMVYGTRLTEVPGSPGSYRLTLRCTVESERPLPPETMLWKHFILLPVKHAQRYLGTQQLAPSTGSESSLDQAHEWLVSCLNDHPFCEAHSRALQTTLPNGIPFCPPRLIEIRPSGIRLHHTQNKLYHYVALSHRWPSNLQNFLRLTTSNIRDLERSIPEDPQDGFSRVFSDAVSICRRKSFAYLWIDSLCIIQEGDAGADWRHQATLMGKIYQNALCTIAVHAISDPDESFSKGIFRERNVGLVTPFASAASIAKADNTYLPVSNYYLIPEYDWAAGVARSPLSRRGWVIQERHLSQRILHFTEDQIFFECYETVQTEGWPGGHPVQSIGRIQRITTDLQALILHRADKIRYADQAAITQKLLDDPLVAWYRMAYTYAGTDLTFPTDKLIAISGLARAMAPFVSASPADYLAGVWVRSLPYGLLWGTSLVDRPEGKPIRPRPPAPYQGPSWSWASINWPATYHHQLHAQPHEKLVAFEGYEVKPKVDPGTGIADPYGEVEPGAWIKVRGTTYGIKLKWKTAKTNTKNSTFFMAEVWTGTGKWPTQNGQSPTVFPDERYIEGETSESRSDLRVMPMLRSSKESTSKWIEMLILEPTGNPSEYRRFGIMEAWGQMGRQWFEWHTGNFIGKNISGKREETITLV